MGLFWNTQNAADCTILIKEKSGGACPQHPSHESESTSLHGYLCAWYVIYYVKKEKPPCCCFFKIPLASVGYCPQTPLVNCECIHFCTNVRIQINLGEKYGTKFGLLLIYYPKIVGF